MSIFRRRSPEGRNGHSGSPGEATPLALAHRYGKIPHEGPTETAPYIRPQLTLLRGGLAELHHGDAALNAAHRAHRAIGVAFASLPPTADGATAGVVAAGLAAAGSHDTDGAHRRRAAARASVEANQARRHRTELTGRAVAAEDAIAQAAQAAVDRMQIQAIAEVARLNEYVDALNTLRVTINQPPLAALPDELVTQIVVGASERIQPPDEIPRQGGTP